MPKEINQWAMYPRKTSPSPLPESRKMEVTTKANELIETVLKPKYIQPPVENPRFNYIVDIYGNRYVSKYAKRGSGASRRSYETLIVRMAKGERKLNHDSVDSSPQQSSKVSQSPSFPLRLVSLFIKKLHLDLYGILDIDSSIIYYVSNGELSVIQTTLIAGISPLFSPP